MSEQGRLFDPDKLHYGQFAPVTGVSEGAARYVKQRGLGEYKPPASDKQVDPARGFSQYRAYSQAQSLPEKPGIRQSYEAMRTETRDQFDFMTRPVDQGGMGFSVEFTDEDPYPSPEDMAKDVGQGRIKALKTEKTGGHGYFSNEENDMFRAVHDVFGHAGIGRGFSRHGEEAAWDSHRQMYSPAAQDALASETRGQNSYLNFGGGEFPDQSDKLIGLPDFARDPGRLSAGQFGAKPKTGESDQPKLDL